MSLPVIFNLFGLSLPAHLVFETLAYGLGFRLYLYLRKRHKDTIDDETRLTVLVGAVLGAAIGSKLLGFLEHPELWGLAVKSPVYFLAAKTILGGLLGGITGVEIAKAMAGITRSTGDIYVFPLLIAIMIGRVGCLLTGISDGTWGNETAFVMGFDAGDGIIRHPTPLYEIVFLAGLGVALLAVQKYFPLVTNVLDASKGDCPPELMRGKPARLERTRNEGDLFKLFIMAYCGWRFVIEFLKPVTTYSLSFSSLNIVQNTATAMARDFNVSGLSILQIAALLGFCYYAWIFAERTLRRGIDGGA